MTGVALPFASTVGHLTSKDLTSRVRRVDVAVDGDVTRTRRAELPPVEPKLKSSVQEARLVLQSILRRCVASPC